MTLTPPDCDLCGYPGCRRQCVCAVCGVGPNAHDDACAYLRDLMESEPYDEDDLPWGPADLAEPDYEAMAEARAEARAERAGWEP